MAHSVFKGKQKTYKENTRSILTANWRERASEKLSKLK